MPSPTRRRTSTSWRASIAVGALVAAAAASPVATGSAGASPAPEVPAENRPFVSGDQTIPVYDPAAAISERIEVETELDSDEDGELDRIYVELTRPNAGGVDVPLIVQASPYYGQFGSSTWLDDFFVPRGYAFAFVSLPGTDLSSGCDDVGADFEVLGTKAVVDWVNGRADGFDADTGSPNVASWATGKVGMIGVSWDGTIANAVASTGVEGLETIVPIAAISSWYDYTRGNGIPFYRKHVKFLHEYVSNFDSPRCRSLTSELQAGSADSSGNYNDWWVERDYRPDASNITASVFVAHGLSDENVKTRQFGAWWDELVAHDVERKLFLHQGDHIDPYDFGTVWTSRLHKWFDYSLQDLDNGVPDGPQVTIQRENGSWVDEEVWPPTGTTPRKMLFSAPLGRSAGALTVERVPVSGSARKVTFTQSQKESDDSVVSDPTTPRGDRAVFLSDELSDDLRESGTAEVKLRVRVNRDAAGFHARVVDYHGGAAYVVSRTSADLGHPRVPGREGDPRAGQVVHAQVGDQHRRPDLHGRSRARRRDHRRAPQPDGAVPARHRDDQDKAVLDHHAGLRRGPEPRGRGRRRPDRDDERVAGPADARPREVHAGVLRGLLLVDPAARNAGRPGRGCLLRLQRARRPTRGTPHDRPERAARPGRFLVRPRLPVGMDRVPLDARGRAGARGRRALARDEPVGAEQGS